MKVGCGGLSTTDKKQEQEKSEKNLAKTWHFREVFLYSTLHHFVYWNFNFSLFRKKMFGAQQNVPCEKFAILYGGII